MREILRKLSGQKYLRVDSMGFQTSQRVAPATLPLKEVVSTTNKITATPQHVAKNFQSGTRHLSLNNHNIAFHFAHKPKINKENLMAAETKVPRILNAAIDGAYKPAGMQITTPPVRELGDAGAEYSACRLGLDHHNIVFRKAKITPERAGQFVTILKRSGGKNMPLDIRDGVDFVVVDVSDSTHYGQFVFDKKTLLREGIMSGNGKKGKMAIRVYPHWSKPIGKWKINIKTQKWQTQCFLPFLPNGTANPAQVRKLFQLAPTLSAAAASLPRGTVGAKLPATSSPASSGITSGPLRKQDSVPTGKDKEKIAKKKPESSSSDEDSDDNTPIYRTVLLKQLAKKRKASSGLSAAPTNSSSSNPSLSKAATSDEDSDDNTPIDRTALLEQLAKKRKASSSLSTTPTNSSSSNSSLNRATPIAASPSVTGFFSGKRQPQTEATDTKTVAPGEKLTSPAPNTASLYEGIDEDQAPKRQKEDTGDKQAPLSAASPFSR